MQIYLANKLNNLTHGFVQVWDCNILDYTPCTTSLARQQAMPNRYQLDSSYKYCHLKLPKKIKNKIILHFSDFLCRSIAVVGKHSPLRNWALRQTCFAIKLCNVVVGGSIVVQVVHRVAIKMKAQRNTSIRFSIEISSIPFL